MRSLFSTALVHPRDRFDYWHSVACKQIVGHDSVPDDRLTFQADIRAASFANLDLVEFSNSPMRVAHTLAHVERTRPDTMFVCIQLSGKMRVVQNAREVDLCAGTLMLIEPLMPYSAEFSENSRTLLIKAPRREMCARVGRNRELIGHRVTAERLDDALTLDGATKLPSLAGQTSTVTEELMANHVLDLVGLSVARTITNVAGRVSNPRALLLGQIRSIVDAKLADPDLDGQTVADIVGISVRYANELLADQDSSLHRLILSRRLARCRSALEDPNQAHRTVSEIARGWGFSDMTYFGRRFKAAYGVSPGEYQKAAVRFRHVPQS
ncbi:helix-turn-helix domain-containing protein [Rhodopseudomonas sp. BR0G17]|uniref:AraC-like ligand-binding domain-containing protein n=1 Tax=Rhodopseudomonas sp. BR0G17 TaxID=2269368 RepID=UPI0013E0DC5D|nr:helix-turn-helix domain-containing protein [Rhodopseudomonas sp. BR0G17]NEW96696.1 helix-turn-helix domain-containing protein [Rhodopseudomonas sp. BR0G17]